MVDEIKENQPSEQEQQIARDTLERYSGSNVQQFCSYLLLTNFSKYVDYFAETRNICVYEGSMFKVAHSSKENISILDFKIGSPAAALVVDLCSHLPIKASLMLGMCGGLRRQYQIGEYFVPVASIRAEGTSDFYFEREVPAMANFLVQKTVIDVLVKEKINYHIGITHTTNKRFWEFNEGFCEHLKETRPQGIEMECATLFMAGYYHKLPVGALLLISDLPLKSNGIKTKESSDSVFSKHTSTHVEDGVRILKALDASIKRQAKGIYRGVRRRFEDKQ